ncbi:MAG: GNAT family protein [Anaerolineae bacterium]|nr:GNAT family protein [Anaerolineae bacterium]MDQ7034293.1 GNAT family protein [Anaerolineae bacterium]
MVEQIFLNENEVLMNQRVFDFSSFPSLATERLMLREITPEDVTALLMHFGNPEVVKFIAMQPIKTIAQANEWLKWMGGFFAAKDGLRWGITLQDGTFVGSTGLHLWNREAHYAQIGCDIAHKFWGNGYGQEAMREIIDFGWNQMKLNRIEAEIVMGNQASIHVMKKLGFQQEGVLRQRLLKGGKFYDVLIFSVLRQEYRGDS